MSRQQKRAIKRKEFKTGFQKICLAAGEGVSKAVAFSFALASHAIAAEPKKRNRLPCRRWSSRIKEAITRRSRLFREYLCR